MPQSYRTSPQTLRNAFDFARNDTAFVLSVFLPLFIIKTVFVLASATGPSILNDEYLYKFNAESLFLLQKYADAHYPPMYPLVLAPAFIFERWYESMLIINAFASSLIVPSTWFLARTIGMSNPRVPAVLAALIPFHAVYPGFLLGENLFIPLFCLALALAVRGEKASTGEGALFGIVLGMAHLTKYLFLPAIPILYLVWLFASHDTRKRGTAARGVMHALSPALSYAIAIGIWVWYALYSGFDWRQMFGFDISTAGRLITDASSTAHELGKRTRPAALVQWVAAYASFIMLAWMPTWGLAAAWFTQIKPDHGGQTSDRAPKTFIILLVLLVAGFCAIATLHSYGARYNAAQPTKIMGRYLAQLGPPMLVLASFVLEALSRMEIRLRTGKFVLASVLMIALFTLSWWVIAQGGVWNFPKFFYKNQVNLLDVSIFGNVGYLVLGIGTVIAPLLMAASSRRHPALLAAPLGVFLLFFSLGYARMAPFHSDGMNVRMIVSAAASPDYRGKELRVIADKARAQTKALEGAPRFWGLEDTSLILAEAPQDTDSWDALKGKCLLFTSHRFEFPPIQAFSFKSKTFFIYGITENNLDAVKAYLATPEGDGLP